MMIDSLWGESSCGREEASGPHFVPHRFHEGLETNLVEVLVLQCIGCHHHKKKILLHGIVICQDMCCNRGA